MTSGITPRPAEASPQQPTAFPIVGVGASAGGLESFIELFRHVPSQSGMGFVLIQHLDPRHSSYLTEAIARSTAMPVEEARDGMVVQPDHVYAIPPNADVGILKGALTLLPRLSDGRKPHLPIDFFFKALASDRGRQAIGIVLSGTGSDGSEGLEAIKAEGGVTFVQDPKSAKFSGMPDAALRTGAVDVCLPIAELVEELLRVGRHPFVREREAEVLASPEDEGEIRKVLVLLRNTAAVDFSEYKTASVRRRLARRMAVRRVTALRDYVRLLREDRDEVQALFEDILIHVTSFFRDGAAFEKLKEHVFPEILEQKRSGGTIRLWCAGCSTGEEAYSLLIALLEFLEKGNANDVRVQLFGTDVSDKALERARAGVYPDGIARDLGAERLARFFTKADGGGYRIDKLVRERCVFVKHDLARDPPFSKLDLVSCRNVLIYFDQELQRRVLATFQFALNQPGFLLLGHAENIPDGTDLFSPVDKDAKIFARRAVKSALHLAPAKDAAQAIPPAMSEVRARAPSATDIVRRSDALLLEQYAPPGVIVNDRMEILHFRGRTGPYLEPAPGQPQHDLIKMARKGLVAELQIALSRAKRDKTTVRRPGVSVEEDGSTRVCDIVVFPLAGPPESREHVFAVLFEPAPKPAERAPEEGTGGVSAETGAPAPKRAKLEDELRATKDYLQTIIAEHQKTNDELLSTNEELVSSNEELQSLNEELETAKEELQSTNEELYTLNEELQTRNTELNSVNSDLINILGSVEVPIVIVDRGRRIRRFTPKARPILNLLPTDVGRPIDDIKPTLLIDDLDAKIAEVIDTVMSHEEEVRSRDGRWYRLQVRPYTSVEKKIDGAVLSVVDIDALKRALAAAEWGRDYARATVEAVQIPLVVLDEAMKIRSANEAFREKYGLSLAEAEGRDFYEIMDRAWDHPELRAELQGVVEHDGRFERLELTRQLPRLGPRALSLSGRPVSAPTGERLALLAIEDITDSRRDQEERARLLSDTQAAKALAEEANRAKDLFLATLSHELRTPLSSLLMQAQLLRAGKLSEEALAKAGVFIERAARAQAQLIDDLLDISRIVTGKLKLDLSVVDLGSIVRAAVETVAPTAGAKHIDVQLHLDESLPPVSGDPLRLQQASLNLLTNAIKFTPEEGRVIVTVDSVDGQGRIRVSDTGVGIDPSFLPHIFDRFSQEQNRTQVGLGLGLAIVRYLVEAHGGTIHAESPGKGKGSTFTILLPLAKQGALVPARKGGQAPGENAPVSIEGARVLVVEDDPGTREALVEMLKRRGATALAVGSTEEALKTFEEFRPSVLVCDIALPGDDGNSLIRRIRALAPERGRDVPALALSALASEDDRRRAFAAGFQQHLAKPVDIDRLVLGLAELLAQAPTGGFAAKVRS
jgi:two-component system CheB/CheR fusion protein